MENEKNISNRMYVEIGEVGPGKFFYLVAAIVTGISIQKVLLTYWNQLGFSVLVTESINAWVLVGLAILWFLFWTIARWGQPHKGMMS